MIETIVCPLWSQNDKRFHSRHYHVWDRPCRSCGRKIAVSDAVKRRLDSNGPIAIVCEQCALIQAPMPEIEFGPLERAEPCASCATLKQQEQVAAMELAKCKDLPDKAAEKIAYAKWTRLYRAKWGHWFKAHKDDSRGKL